MMTTGFEIFARVSQDGCIKATEEETRIVPTSAPAPEAFAAELTHLDFDGKITAV